MASDTPATFESFQAELARLVARFDRQHPTYTSPDYNEAALRADFLDGFFRALGWDVGNQKGLIHTEREVDIEVRTHLSGKQTRADYVFRLNRIERFTCEAKKPSEVLHNRHIFQAKKDAFARGVPLAILSDFEEMKLYIVGARPHVDDPHTGEWKVLNFRQYNDAARELWDLLGYENVVAGSIDRLIESLPKRPLRLKGRQGYLIKPDRTRALDADFLNFLDDVRQQLGSDLLKHNDRADLLEGHRLNEAAQRIIDRLVFLRICEDRGIDTGTLLQTLFDGWYRQQPDAVKPKLRRPGKQTHLRFGGAFEEEPPADGYVPKPRTEGGLYRELIEHIRALDQRPPSYKPFFNGNLFKPHFSEELVIGDEWLANFLLDLVDDDTGYNFADIKVEILGDAYERFLGKILRPQGRGATIEEKPEVRKAGGVYYTPRYITDYIVEQTVGRLLEGRTPKEAAKLKIIDPACGSGSFLLRAYERVMEHHLRWFTANPDKRRKEDCYLDAAGNVRLTTALKRRILENNIHGVDIDAQAVEVTQLSLYLKMLEHENRETLRVQTELFKKEPLLPPLDRNIKCFNSLIASDFSLDPAELVRVNAGDWDVQFPEILQAGGFDAVIGNPPYGADLGSDVESYIREHYSAVANSFDSFIMFMEHAGWLLRAGGQFGMIVPSGWVSTPSSRKLRLRFSEQFRPTSFISLPYDVFYGAYIDTMIVTAERSANLNTDWAKAANRLVSLVVFPIRYKVTDKSEFMKFEKVGDLADWMGSEDKEFLVLSSREEAGLIRKMRNAPLTLESIVDVMRGLEEFSPRDRRDCKAPKRAFNGEMLRYELDLGPLAFESYSPEIEEAKPHRYFAGPRVLLRQLLSRKFRLQAVYTEAEFLTNQSVQSLVVREKFPSPKFVLALVNSRLLSWYFCQINMVARRDDFPKTIIKQTRNLPFPDVAKRSSADLKSHDRLVALVDKMLTLTPALRVAKSDAEKTTIQNALTKTDREIDQLVYQLYGLTPEEIALVEGVGNPAPAVAAD